MTRHEITTRYPHASESFIRANLSPDDTWTPAKLESSPGDAPLGKEEVQRPVGERFLIRVTSIRKRLLDEDNLCEKYHVDLCRYAGVLPDDAPGKVQIEVCQQKAAKGESEQVVIEVFNDWCKRAGQTVRECVVVEITTLADQTISEAGEA